jgi:sortase A
MPRSRSIENMTTEELRQLLVERRRSERSARLDHFRRTGRVIRVEPVETAVPLDQLHSSAVDEEGEPERVSGRPVRKRRVWMDRFLIGVEVVAVIGLVFILLTGFSMLRNLNHEVASAINLPTAEPTPLIVAVVLPSGHIPGDTTTPPQPNTAEIPEHLRAVVNTTALLPVPTAGPETARHIRIPAIGVDQDIFQGDDWDTLKQGVGQRLGTPNPGQPGNMVLSAHNDIYGETFRFLDQLQAGDMIYVSTSQREYIYIVDQVQIVEPTRVDVLDQTPETIVTLISCYPYLVDNMRIVVTAHLYEQP